MSTDMPSVLTEQSTEIEAETRSVVHGEWVETALTVLFTAVAVMFVSFLAVVTGLV
jgi:hypothetical protein